MVKPRDANIKLFHTNTTNRRWRNIILGLNELVGYWTFEPNSILNIITQNFQNIYTTNLNKRNLHNPVVCENTLNLEDNDNIGRPLDKEEIKNAIFSFKPLKSPGPDGLHPMFFQKYWNDIEVVINTCIKAFSSSSIPTGINKCLFA